MTCLQTRERELLDNLQLRKKMKEIDSVDEKIAELKEKLGDIDVTHLNRDRKRLLQQQEDFMKEVCNFYIFQGGFNFQRSQFLFIYLFIFV